MRVLAADWAHIGVGGCGFGGYDTMRSGYGGIDGLGWGVEVWVGLVGKGVGGVWDWDSVRRVVDMVEGLVGLVGVVGAGVELGGMNVV